MFTYYRETQKDQISEIIGRKQSGSTFNVIRGRRKVGKTTLAMGFAKNPNAVYISLTTKASKLQLEEISASLKHAMPDSIFVPSFSGWSEFFEFMFFVSRIKPIALFIDEFHLFQEFKGSGASDFKKIWEKQKNQGRIHLFAITYDKGFLIEKFGAKDSPYYNMVDNYIPVEPFNLEEIIKICKERHSELTLKEILDLYAVFGGLPKYYDLIDGYKLWNKKVPEIIEELVLDRFAPLGKDHQDILMGDLGRGNRVYIGILQAIALGKQTMTEMAQFIDIPVTNMGKYLNELDKKKELIRRVQPYGFTTKVHSKFGKYEICNPFDNFWFRFIHPYLGDFENGKNDYITENLNETLPDYIRERVKSLLMEIFASSSHNRVIDELLGGDVSKISSIWNRKEHIDLLLVNDDKKVAAAGNMIFADNQYELAATQLSSSLNILKGPLTGYTKKKFLISMGSGKSAFLKKQKEQSGSVDIYSLDELLHSIEDESLGK